MTAQQSRTSQEGRLILNQLRSANGILDAMPQAVFDLLADSLAPVATARGETLIEPYEPVKTICFPLTGLYTAIRHLEDGSSAEVVMVDRAGFIGVSVLGDETFEQNEVRVLVAGTALSVGSDVLRAIMKANPVMHAHLIRAIPVLLAQMSLSAACNARHSVQQRIALWLLKASDRIGSVQLDLTQESISMLIGSRRTGISETLGLFSAAGMVETARHRIIIVDKARLRGYACRCYCESEGSASRHLTGKGWMNPALGARISRLIDAYGAMTDAGPAQTNP